MRHSLVTLAIVSCSVALISCGDGDVQPPLAPMLHATELSTVEEITSIKIPDDEFKETDANLNGRVCAKDTPSGGLVLTDDNEQTPSQQCPPAFAIYSGYDMVPINPIKEGDDNRNGVVCAKSTASGGTIVRDDNPATPSQPCPPAFEVVGTFRDPAPKVKEEDLIAADANKNSLVCLKQNASGNFLISDDNTATPSQPCAPAFMATTIGMR